MKIARNRLSYICDTVYLKHEDNPVLTDHQCLINLCIIHANPCLTQTHTLNDNVWRICLISTGNSENLLTNLGSAGRDLANSALIFNLSSWFMCVCCVWRKKRFAF